MYIEYKIISEGERERKRDKSEKEIKIKVRQDKTRCNTFHFTGKMR